MRGKYYKAGLGTILIFAGYYCLKAAFAKPTPTHGRSDSRQNKPLLVVAGLLSIAAGIFLIWKEFSDI